MLELITLIVRAVQFVFAIIVLGLTGHSTLPYQPLSGTVTNMPPSVASYGDTPSQDSFMVFTAIWTMLVLIYLALSPRFFPKIAHPYAILGLDALTMLFWFAGFIALAVFEHDFSYNVGFYTFGCGSFCGEFKAAAVFGAFEW